ncbi:MAG: formyltransferase family protein [Sphingorhabdus sp.]
MRAVIIGAVESTEVAINAAGSACGWSIPLVVTLKSDLAARHSDFCDLSEAASKAGALVHQTAQVNNAETIAAIVDAKPDYIFVIGWSQICGPAFLATAPDRVIGYHPAALPRLRGRAAIPWTILNDESITAGSLFWIDEGVDSGAILEQQFFHVAPDETAASLYAKHMDALAIMVTNALDKLAAGTEVRKIQDDRYATWAARRTAQDGQIDWTCGTAEILRLIRAVGRPYPGAFTYQNGEPITFWSASALPEGARHHARPGQIVGQVGDGLIVKTIDGLLLVEEWESETGKRPAMHAKLGGVA